MDSITIDLQKGEIAELLKLRDTAAQMEEQLYCKVTESLPGLMQHRGAMQKLIDDLTTRIGSKIMQEIEKPKTQEQYFRETPWRYVDGKLLLLEKSDGNGDGSAYYKGTDFSVQVAHETWMVKEFGGKRMSGNHG